MIKVGPAGSAGLGNLEGVEFSGKGERRHKITPSNKIKELLSYVKKYKSDITIIIEGPDIFEDAMKTLKLIQ